MTSLMAVSALSMGIGYLLGEIGFIFRGSMLGKSNNTKAEVRTEFRLCELGRENDTKLSPTSPFFVFSPLQFFSFPVRIEP